MPILIGIIVLILLVPYIPAILYGIYLALCAVAIAIGMYWEWLVGIFVVALVISFLAVLINKR